MFQNNQSLDANNNINEKTVHPIVKIQTDINTLWNNTNYLLGLSIRETYLTRPPRNGSSKFTILDGPPFATGLPHYGHFLAGSLKDVVMRYKTMKGYEINKTAGWDVHGVPMEMAVNKKLNINTKEDIIKIGIDKYCTECKDSVLTCAKDWCDIMNTFGRWANFENPYTTMDFKYSEKVWSMFNLLFEENLIVQGYRVGAYSTALETSLSNFESSLNYIQRNDQSLTFAVKLINFKLEQFQNMDHYIAIFTTTPWSLPGNCAVAINKDAMYEAKIENNKVIFYVADKKSKNNCIIQGLQLIGQGYEPLFDFTNHFYGYTPNKFYKIYHGDFVKTTNEESSTKKDVGTGAVHIAPMFGEDDFALCLSNGLIEQDGKHLYDYLNSCGEFEDYIGKYFDSDYKQTVCFSNNAKIIKFIKTNLPDSFINSEQLNHSYPHCWRTNTPLIYRATPSWMVAVSKFKDELLALNSTINWFPENVGTGRFHQWLQNARDWNISRARFWGTPLPVWKQIDGNDIIIIKSAHQLEELCGLPSDSLTDLHRNKIDNLLIQKNGKTYKRIDDVFDCWFESGCVPYFFSNDSEYIPADFIAEGLDQTRGWFYTLLVLGYVCSKVKNNKPEPAFKNVMVNGLVLAKDGKKMSKSLKNYTDPMIIVRKYGADALRMYLLSSPASKAEDLKFDDDGVHKQMKNILIPFYNTLQFIDIYRTLHKKEKLNNFENMGFLDINSTIHSLNAWILNKTSELEKNIHNCYENYKLDHVIYYLEHFVDILNNSYIKLNRPFFKNQERDPDVNPITVESIHTINFVMLRLAYLLSPVAPYFAEYIFQTVKSVIGLESQSIHLTYYDEFYKFNVDTNINKKNQINFIEYEFKLLDDVRKLRISSNLAKTKVLKRAFYYTSDFDQITDEFKDEMNIIDIEIHNINNFTNVIKLVPSLNTGLIDKTFKKDRNIVKQLLSELNENQYKDLKDGNKLIVNNFEFTSDLISEWTYSLINDEKTGISGKKLLLEHLNTNNNINEENLKYMVGPNFILFLDTTYDTEMINKFFMHNIARKFQKMRKYAGLNPWDPVNLHIDTTDEKIINIITDPISQKSFKEVTNKTLHLGHGSDKLYEFQYNSSIDNNDIELALYLYKN